MANLGWRKRRCASLIRLVALVALWQMAGPLPAVPPAQPQSVVAHSAAGDIEGGIEGAVAVWRGIPYAAAPVGDLRWRPPQPAARFDGVRQAGVFGASCPQIAESPTQLSPLGPQSEDCLFLNVWAPRSAAGKGGRLPVMVWLHGGGFIAGAGSEAQFDGTAFARQGVILVTLNYRLGRLGFFAHPALAAEAGAEPQGNYGLMDQIAALRWVRQNIAAFGGDPGNVTLFGESAGAISAVALSTSPMAQGLFHKMIVESAPLRVPLRSLRDDRPELPSAQTLGRQWAESVGIDGDGAGALAALRALPVERIAPVAASPADIFAIITASGPMADGQMLTEAPAEAYAGGRQMAVPMIVGSNGREDVVWSFEGEKVALVPITGLTGAQVLSKIADPEQRRQVAAHYRTKGEGDAAMRSDAFAGASAYFLARAARAPAWLYRFDAVPPQVGRVVGQAPHGTELFYVFGTLDHFPYRAGESGKEARKISAAMVRYWTGFARTGRPSVAGASQWPAFAGDRPSMLQIDNSGVANVVVRDAGILDILADASLR